METDGQTNRQTDIQIDRQTYIHTDRHKVTSMLFVQYILQQFIYYNIRMFA